MNFNKVMLAGNLTRNPESRQIGGNAVANFGLAVNRRYKTSAGEQREETTFVDCEAWGRTAEVIGQHFSKGKPIFIEGRLKLEEWDDKASGAKRSKLKVSVESFQFVGGRDDASGESRRPAPVSRAAAGSHLDDDDSFPF